MTPLELLSAPHPKGVFHGVPAETYFASPGVSNSMLKGYAEDPLDFLYALNSPPAPASEAQMVGTVAHRMILEGKLGIPPGFAVKPEGMSFATKDGKAWREANAGAQIITQEKWDNCRGMAEAVANDGDCALFLRSGKPEAAIYAPDEKTGLTMRCRSDFLPDDQDTRFDLKTAESASKAEFARAIGKFRYHYQAAWNLAVEEAATGVRPKVWAWIVVKSAPPFQRGIYFASPADIEAGHKATRFYFEHLAAALKSGKFVSTASKFEFIERPQYFRREDIS